MTKWVRNCQKLGHALLIMNIVNTGVGNGCHSNAVAPIARIYTSALLRGPSVPPPFSHGLPRVVEPLYALCALLLDWPGVGVSVRLKPQWIDCPFTWDFSMLTLLFIYQLDIAYIFPIPSISQRSKMLLTPKRAHHRVKASGVRGINFRGMRKIS